MISLKNFVLNFMRNGSLKCRKVKCLDKCFFFRKKNTKIKIIQKVFIIFQYPYILISELFDIVSHNALLSSFFKHIKETEKVTCNHGNSLNSRLVNKSTVLYLRSLIDNHVSYVVRISLHKMNHNDTNDLEIKILKQHQI